MLYPVAIEIGSDTEAYSVVFPDVKGCFSAGDTLEEAIKNAKEALEFYFESYAEDGVLPPEASSVKEHINNPEFAGWTWVFIEIDLEPYMGKSSKINVTLPNLLTKKIDDVVAGNSAYQSRSHFLQIAALHEIANNVK